MVTTRSSRPDISRLLMLDIELSLLRLAWPPEILRLPGLLGLLSTFPLPDN